MAIIELKSLSKSYNRKAVVDELSLVVERGERLVILGPSGCGKSTVLRLIAGLIAPDSGSISVDGRLVSAEGKIIVPPERRNVGMVFQDLALWPHLTVEGNIGLGLKSQGVLASERQRRISEALALVKLDSYMAARPGELSGGQQQRVALARALVLQPSALLMDEPLSNLDEELNLHLRSEIIRLHQQLGFTLIYVTHNRAEAGDIATRLATMRLGRIEQNHAPQAPR